MDEGFFRVQEKGDIKMKNVLMFGKVALGAFIICFVLKYGWMSILWGHGGNALITPIFETSQSSSMSIRLIAPVFFFALLTTAPFLARAEEEIFRRRYYEWNDIVKQSIKFGFSHCWMGVSLALGLALIIPGFFFGYKYRRGFDQGMEAWRNGGDGACSRECEKARDEAVMVTTTYHTMYNTILIIVLLVITLEAV